MKTTKVTNISWDYDYEEFWQTLSEKLVEKQAKILDIPYNRYIEMNETEREEYAYDVFRRTPSVANEVFELPNEVELPNEDWTEELITDYLSNEYGFFIKGYTLIEIE